MGCSSTIPLIIITITHDFDNILQELKTRNYMIKDIDYVHNKIILFHPDTTEIRLYLSTRKGIVGICWDFSYKN